MEEAGRRVATDGFTSGGSAAAAPPVDTLGCREGGRGARERGCGTNQEKKEERRLLPPPLLRLTNSLFLSRHTGAHAGVSASFKKHYFMDFRN